MCVCVVHFHVCIKVTKSGSIHCEIDYPSDVLFFSNDKIVRSFAVKINVIGSIPT